jgi:ribosome-binding protein aMBF1 (putative translation factor)
MLSQTIEVEVEGKPYVFVPKQEYELLQLKSQADNLPALPERGADGMYPALEYSRISLARKIIQARVDAGLTQQELAARARVRLESLRRLEAGQSTLSIATVDKIDRALQQVAKPARRARKA